MKPFLDESVFYLNMLWPSEPVPTPMQGGGWLSLPDLQAKEIASGWTFSTNLTNHHRSSTSGEIEGHGVRYDKR